LLFGKVTSNDLTGEEKERIANRSQFFAIMNGKLMRQFVAIEIPKECISDNQIQKFLKEFHEKRQTCEEMIKQATQGPYWLPTITRDIQSFIKQGNGTPPTKQKNALTKEDWRKPIVEYLIHGTTGDQHPFEQKNGTYFMEEGELRKFYKGQRVVRRYLPYKQEVKPFKQQRWMGPYTITRVYDDNTIQIESKYQKNLGRWRSNKFLLYDWITPDQVINFDQKAVEDTTSQDYNEVHHILLENYSTQPISIRTLNGSITKKIPRENGNISRWDNCPNDYN
jgi:hypothetical protein